VIISAARLACWLGLHGNQLRKGRGRRERKLIKKTLIAISCRFKNRLVGTYLIVSPS